jgi:hypothetical protein
MQNNTGCFESAMNIYRTLDRSVRLKKMLGEKYNRDFTLQELEELRDEAFRNIQLHTIEHEDAFNELKQELNLLTYDKA